MDISLKVTPPINASTQTNAVQPQPVATKVHAIEPSDHQITALAAKPFVAQVVIAQLSGSVYPANPAEILPPDRTLRPYNMPMLPYENDQAAANGDAVQPDQALIIQGQEAT